MKANENPAPRASGDRAQPKPASSPLSQTPADAQDIWAEREALMRDFIFEALAPVEADTAATRLCLRNDDDTGARYHLKRVVACVREGGQDVPRTAGDSSGAANEQPLSPRLLGLAS
jgi:hypothetical protein